MIDLNLHTREQVDSAVRKIRGLEL